MENVKYLLPQPLVVMAGQAWALFTAKTWNRKDPAVDTAARVFAYSLTRMVLAGAFFYALNRYKPDTRIASGAMATVVSAPATAMYWGGKYVFDGLKTIKDQLKNPTLSLDFVKSAFNREVGKGVGVYLIGIFILNSHHRFQVKEIKGGVEWLMTKGLTPAQINNEPY